MTQELLELEEGFWHAAGNGDYYRQHMAPNGVCVLAFGMMDKDDTIEAISVADPWAEFEFSDMRTIDLGDDEAAICYRANASRENGDKYEAMISSVYTRFHGDWKLTLHQQTPIETG